MPEYKAAIAPELQTLRDWLRYAVSRFTEAQLVFGHGTANAFDEAAYLVLHTLHLPLERLDAFLDARLLPGERARLHAVIERRAAERVPAAYITQEAWIGDHAFYVDERVIVPRSFIGHLLLDALAPWITEPARITRVLDLCTGSGCLAILAALCFPQAQVDAADVSADALAVARINVDRYLLAGRVQLIESDMFVKLTQEKYYLIVSNPPYVGAAAMRALPEEYRREPQLALAGGEYGLDHVRVILREAGKFLAPEGVLVVEAGDNRVALETAFPRLAFTWLETQTADRQDVAPGEPVVFLLRASDLAAS